MDSTIRKPELARDGNIVNKTTTAIFHTGTIMSTLGSKMLTFFLTC